MSPSRRRWKRKVLAVLALVLVAHWLWGKYEGRGLEADLAALASAGEPVDASVLTQDPPELDETQNGASEYDRAAGLLDTRDPLWNDFDQASPRPPFTPAELVMLRTILRDRARALALVDAATAKPTARWMSYAGHCPMEARVYLPSDFTWLVDLLALAAVEAHVSGDDVAALGRVEQMRILARRIEAHGLSDTWSRGRRIDVAVCETLLRCAPDLRIAPSVTPAPAVSAGEIPPGRMRALIDLLADDRPSTTGVGRELTSSRLVEVDAMRRVADGRMDLLYDCRYANEYAAWLRSLGAYVIRPFVMQNARMALAYQVATHRAVSAAPDWPTCKALAGAPPPECEGPGYRYFLARFAVSGATGTARLHYRAATDRHLTAAALAIRWFAVDHGRLPATLDELVPVYMPAVPNDPMARAAPLRYRSGGADPVVYSVGEDGRDDGGSETPNWKSKFRQEWEYGRWERVDCVVHLQRQPRPPSAPSTE